VNLSKWAGANSNFEILNLGLPEYFRSRIASGGSNPARLGELGGNLVPLFPINRQKGAVPNIPHPLAMHFSCFGWKKLFPWRKSKSRCFRNASEMFSRANSWRFSVNFTVLHPFFVLQRVSFRIWDFQFFSCFLSFHLHFVHFRFSFLLSLTRFYRLFKPLSRLINDKMNFNRSFVL